MKHLGFAALKDTAKLAPACSSRVRRTSSRLLWKFNSVYNPQRQIADHRKPVTYQMRLPEVQPDRKKIDPMKLYVIQPLEHEVLKAAQIKAEAEAAICNRPPSPRSG